MKVLSLGSGLFPDGAAVEAAIRVLEEDGHTVSRIDLGRLAADDDAAWDAVVGGVLAADKVVTV